MIGFVFSIQDAAGRGIATALTEDLGVSCEDLEDPRAVVRCVDRERETVVMGFRDDVVYLEYLDLYFERPLLVAVLSRHSSSSGIPSLTVHYTGNPRREAVHGGDPMTLSYTRPSLSTSFLRSIYETASLSGLLEKFEIGYEATHHGPTRNRSPLVFLEIGSSEREWGDRSLHRLWSRAIMRVLEGGYRGCERIVIGIGGPHYPERFTRLAIENRFCFSHIIPRYALRELDREGLLQVLREAVEKTLERVDAVVIERKSLSREQTELLERYVVERGLELVSI